MSDILAIKWWGNRVEAYLWALVSFVLALLVLRVLRKVLFGRLRAWAKKTPTSQDDLALAVTEQTVVPIFYAGAFYFAMKQLVLSAALDKLVTALGVIVLTVQVTRLVLAGVIYYIEQTWLKQAGQNGTSPISKSILTVTRVAVWGLAGVFILGNLGFNVSAVVAGLGIGGVAVALAAQTILGDLFNYFVIFFDRPFEEGDTIVFDDYTGVIENIGIKSTRIRALSGEQIVVSNTNLVSSKIRNYKRMSQRRVAFSVGIVYETPLEKVKKVPVIVRQIIEGIGGTQFDRVHLKELGSYSLNYEIVYYVLSSDMMKYLDIQQAINLQLMEAFAKEGLEFAYPTQVALQRKID